ncbi:MAG: A/G-specific adenine glycosylase [Pseudomonadota bacterium]
MPVASDRVAVWSATEAPASGLSAQLIAWQRQHGRHALPWQGTRDPYRVWLSEIMLQQTQVTTVLGYYERFLQHFPDVAALAAAPQDAVLAQWAGLGYYSRARNLHRCAQDVVGRFDGAFPSDPADLESLPGIGRSTAAAIAAFCFGRRTAICDGNVRRVLSRVLGFDEDLAQAAAQRRLWDIAEALLPAQDIEAYTQGLMDLGATLCTPRRPDCERCPWRDTCVARAQQRQADYPRRSRRLQRGRRDIVWLWLQEADGAVWLCQRPQTGIWAGLWCLPECEDLAQARAVGAALGVRPQVLAPFKHVLTHQDLWLQPVLLRLSPEVDVQAVERHLRGLGPQEPVPAACRRVLPHQRAAHGLPAPLQRLLESPPQPAPADLFSLG